MKTNEKFTIIKSDLRKTSRHYPVLKDLSTTDLILKTTKHAFLITLYIHTAYIKEIKKNHISITKTKHTQKITTENHRNNITSKTTKMNTWHRPSPTSPTKYISNCKLYY